MINGSLIKVKSIAECSKGSILQYFWPALSDNWLWKPIFSLFESGRFTQVLLYNLSNKHCLILYSYWSEVLWCTIIMGGQGHRLRNQMLSAGRFKRTFFHTRVLLDKSRNSLELLNNSNWLWRRPARSCQSKDRLRDVFDMLSYNLREWEFSLRPYHKQ